MSKSPFPIPEGVTDISDAYQLGLVHFELKNLKPKGTILFSGEKKELPFQFFSGGEIADGFIARSVAASSAHTNRVLDSVERYSGMEAFVTLTLLQFKVMFLASRMKVEYQNGQRLLRIPFPGRLLKSHRRKFIRIPFNDSFPAELRFQTEKGPVVRKLRDLSREGMRIALEPGDSEFMVPGFRMKQAVLKVLNREMPVGLNVVAVHGAESAGIKIVAISDSDKLWIKDCVRILMGQILGIDNQKFSDELEPGEKT